MSYSVKQDPLTGHNASMVFIDEPSDKSGNTYATFVCDLGYPYFRIDSRTALGTRSGEKAFIFYRSDGGALRQAVGYIRENRQTGKLSVLEFNYTQSSDVVRAFLTSQKNVVIRIQATTMVPRTMNFATAGFVKGFRAVKQCD
ncbi:hypothetical protein [Deinococcus sp. NW-56]|uniref:hypothetical protein n=1 Tax=Deinococcus sp. NW-56 TaxID=2080419 RepID=UPI000CF40CAD|nr:hypothetical protein [Deinococcus sp. NW-56]